MPIDREKFAREAAPFAGPDGVSAYAIKAHGRCLADLYFLARVRAVGPVEAGRQTCEVYGHDGVGDRCIRCGANIVLRR